MKTYTVQDMGNGFYSVDEQGVRSILAVGSERAVLIDTGFGTGDLKAAVQEVTDKPLQLVNTHADSDHLGCNAQFGEAYLHPSDFHLYEARTGRADMQPLWEGDVLDLGGLKLEVIHIPGHTPGSIALLERERRILIGGDTVQPGPVYMFGTARNLAAYRLSLLKLLAMADAYDTVYASHGELEVQPDILNRLVEASEKLMAGELEAKPIPAEMGLDAECKLYVQGDIKLLY